MEDGFGWWVLGLFVIMTVFWAAIWWWLPARFRNRGSASQTRERDLKHHGEGDPLIASWAGRAPGSRGMRPPDERIGEEISRRLDSHQDVDARHIAIALHDGEVTLDGTVASRTESRAAEAIADSVAGVKAVHNRLRVGDTDPQNRNRPA